MSDLESNNFKNFLQKELNKSKLLNTWLLGAVKEKIQTSIAKIGIPPSTFDIAQLTPTPLAPTVSATPATPTITPRLTKTNQTLSNKSVGWPEGLLELFYSMVDAHEQMEQFTNTINQASDSQSSNGTKSRQFAVSQATPCNCADYILLGNSSSYYIQTGQECFKSLASQMWIAYVVGTPYPDTFCPIGLYLSIEAKASPDNLYCNPSSGAWHLQFITLLQQRLILRLM